MTEVVLAAVLGFLFAVGTYLVLRRDIVHIIWGVIIVSQSANVYLVTMSSLAGDGVPIIDAHGGHGEVPATVDPLLQALVLTAIVIGFGTTAFALVLTYRTYEEHGTIDMFALVDEGEGAADAEAVATDGGEDDAEADATRDEASAADGGDES